MKRLLAVCLFTLLGCQTAARHLRLAPLEEEGEVHLYLEPFPKGSERLAFTVESISAAAADGGAAPLELALPDLSAARVAGQRLLAWGRLAPGSYRGLLLKLRRATLEAEGAVSDLLVPPEPVRIEVTFSVEKRKATVLWLWFRPDESVKKGFAFTPAFSAGSPDAPFADVVGYCSNTAAHSLTVLDRRARKVVGVLPTGRGPMGIAIDPLRRRAYVALSGDDQVGILDIQSAEEVGRIPLRPGDRPQELALTPDGRTLVVANAWSNSVSFVDPAAGMEISRVPAGNEPASLVLDRSGQRGYVFNRRSASITVLDLPNRAVAGSVGTDPEPLRGRLNRAGNRLYVICDGSPYLTALSLPDLAVVKRAFVGLGQSALEVDSRTDLIYVGGRDEDRLRVLDPASFLPASRLEVPGPVSLTAIDDVENVLFSVVPSRRSVAANDLVSGRSLPALEVGADPYQVAVMGERR